MPTQANVNRGETRIESSSSYSSKLGKKKVGPSKSAPHRPDAIIDESSRNDNLLVIEDEEINNQIIKEKTLLARESNVDPEWNTVENKKKRKPLKKIEGINKEVELRGIIKQIHLHAYKFIPETTAEEIKNYLTSKNIENIEVSKMNSKYPDKYASFKISAPELHADLLQDPEMWPKGVFVNRFLFRLGEKSTPT